MAAFQPTPKKPRDGRRVGGERIASCAYVRSPFAYRATMRLRRSRERGVTTPVGQTSTIHASVLRCRLLYATIPGAVGDPRLYKKLWEGDLVTGDRVRATIAWDNCPTLGQVAPAPVATDLDLILYNSDRGYYVYSSQSVTDSVEGFDVDIRDDGHYEVYWTYLDGSIGCDALGSYRMEPFAYAVAWWTSQ